jgi:hypothetical protein
VGCESGDSSRVCGCGEKSGLQNSHSARRPFIRMDRPQRRGTIARVLHFAFTASLLSVPAIVGPDPGTSFCWRMR